MKDLSDFLHEFCGDHIISKFDCETQNIFYLDIICKIKDSYEDDYNKFSVEWLMKFSLLTRTNWIVRYTYPNIKRLAFRKTFVCQHASHNKTANETKCRSRNKFCTAKVDFRAKKINRFTQKNDANLKRGLNVTINVSFNHSHLIEVAEAFSYLRCEPNIELDFQTYFESGMTPSAAKTYHEMKLMEKYGANSFTYLANGHLNPIDNHVYYLFQKWRTSRYGDRAEQNINEVIMQRKIKLEEEGFVVTFKENPRIIVIITPIMKRIFLEGLSEEIVFVDTTSSCDQTNTNVTFCFTAHKVGAIPVACVLHSEQSEANYTLAFSAVKEALEKDGSEKKFKPRVIMTDDSQAERNSLQAVFPESRLLLCAFHVSQAFWRWLCDGRHGVDKTKRQHIMLEFHNLLYANTPTEAETRFNEFLKGNYVKENEKLCFHLNEIWKRKEEWCIAYRCNAITRGHNTNNYTEASIRILKDVILQRCRVFNVCALIDFITTIFEKYHHRRLLDFANMRRNKLNLYSDFAKKGDTLTVIRVNSHEFNVLSSKDEKVFYTININAAFCDCVAGKGGSFCKHLYAVENQHNFVFQNSPRIDTKDRIMFAKLALGEVDETFYESMINSSSNEHGKHLTNFSIHNTYSTSLINENPHSTNLTNDANTQQFEVQYQVSLSNLKKELNRLVETFEQNPSSGSLKAINSLTNHLKRINTSNQAADLILNKMVFKRSRKIKVQPTAISRRKQTTKGAKTRNRVQSGRVVKKRSHSLLSNINNNVPNAKK